MSEVVLNAKRRETGRSNARTLRRQGIVPGVYYFHGDDPVSISATELALRPLIYTAESHLVRLKLDDGFERTCILKDLDFDPITDRPLHFDLLGVAANEAIRVEVPIVLVGNAAGQRDGGIVDHMQHKLEIECLPGDLPEHIEVDITNLGIGDSIHVSDLSVPKATIMTSEEATIVAVAPPRVSMDVEPGTEVAEPELISRSEDQE